MRPVFRKLIAIGSIAAVVGAGWLFDWVRSTTFTVEFTKVERVGDTPRYDEEGEELPVNVGVCDGDTKMNISIRVTHYGDGVSDHVLYVKTNRGVIGRMTTDADGYVNFTYDCYYSLTASDVVFTANDENNSVFVMVPASGSYTMKMVAFAGDPGGMTTNDIFFDIDEGGEA